MSRSCFGCFPKPTLITAVDEPLKRLKIQGRTVKKSSISEEFWGLCYWEIFPLHVLSLFRTSNGIGSLPDDGFYCTRYGHCQYVWISCSVNCWVDLLCQWPPEASEHQMAIWLSPRVDG